jgi:hypothetical protein
MTPIGPPPSTAVQRPQVVAGALVNSGALPRPSGGEPLAPWRAAIYDRAARLQAALDRLPDAKASPDYQTAQACIAEALTAARFLPVKGSVPARFRNALTGILGSGSQTDRAWMAIHRGEEALLMIADVATLRAEALRMFPAAFRLGSPDPLSIVYVELLGRLVAPLKLPGSIFTHPSPTADDGAVAARGPGANANGGAATAAGPPLRGATMEPSQ